MFDPILPPILPPIFPPMRHAFRAAYEARLMPAGGCTASPVLDERLSIY